MCHIDSKITLTQHIELQKTSYSQMKYKINGFHKDDATNATFKAADESVISVADYYANVLRKPVQYPKLPLVRVGGKNSSKKKLFPFEYCIMKANQKVKKLSDDQIANLIRFAAKPCKINIILTKTLPSRAPSLHGNRSESDVIMSFSSRFW